MNSKYKYLGKNTIIFAISSFGTKFLSFFLVPLYTAVLSTTELDILIVNINTSNVPVVVIEKRDYGRNILSYGFRVLIIGTLACSIVLRVVYEIQILRWPIYYYIFIVLYFFSTALYEMMTNYLRAIDEVKEVAIAGVLSSFHIMPLKKNITQ